MIMVSIIKTDQFLKNYKKVAPDIQKAVDKVLSDFELNPSAGKLRLHPLTDTDPIIWKIDVFPNHSWQISMTKKDDEYSLLALARHKKFDRRK
ncbi:hypothetical protein [uncultured Parasutterella sp.]|jgi:hypothetical protein|uniref:hypothetical protein n=1 Tax=uncultured Parasutterella sp. TaxID=1263098 RepID=UPI0025F2DCBD|nr:hypothetical protein [uncultured Parasutterella sp.]